MRHCRIACPWKVLAVAGSALSLLVLATIILKYPQFLSILELTPHNIECPSRPCIRKCCPLGEELQKPNPASSGCYVTQTSHFNVSDIAQENNGSTLKNENFAIVSKNCKKFNPEEYGDKVVLLENGSVKINDEDIYQLSDYCIDFKKEKTYVFICSDEETVIRRFIFGQILSECCLFITLLVYLVIYGNNNLRQRLQINLTHLLVLLNYLPSLLSAYISMSVVYENPYNLNRDHLQSCKTVAFIVQFSFLASFFWLNVMCFDIWLVFSDLKPVQGKKHKKFLFYSLYAWGLPLVIVAISIAMDLIPGIPDSYIKPRFGEQKCWFADKEGTLLYFYLPIAIVVVMNMIMFVSTAIKLRAHTQSTKAALNTSESRRTNENDRDRYNLYLKLFIIMGINWVMELVSFFVGGPKSVWFITDLGNTLQGVLIFVIFVCKRRILRLLNEKLCPQWQIIQDSSMGRSKVSSCRTNSSTISKSISETQDSVALRPMARNQFENEE